MIEFFVPGIPKPGGSKKGFLNPKTKRVVVVEDCAKSADWRGDVRNAAIPAMAGMPLLTGPLRLTVFFRMPRPKGHYGSGKNAGTLKPTAPAYSIVKPDATKLVRSLEDALTGVVWGDDAQVAVQHIEKRYSAQPGALVAVEQLTTH